MQHTTMMLAAALALVGAAGAGRASEPEAADGGAQANIHLRGRLDNCRIQFARAKTGHVAFIGGSITEMNGYRPMVCQMLPKKFPDTKFTFTDAGISSTCSTTGAFRLADDVLSKGPVDLFFIEFAVNDDQDAAHPRRQAVRGMEGIIRRARRHNPNMDIVITYFVNPPMLALLQAGKTPVSIGAHDEVARHYGIATIHLAGEVARRVKAGTLTWQQFGGTHPKPLGNWICADMIGRLVGSAWAKPLPAGAAKRPHPLPAKPLDPMNYGNGRLIDPAKAKVKGGWKLAVPQWKKLKGNCRRRFANTVMLSADAPGAELTLEFSGTAIGAYVLAGPDAGIAQAAIDGGPFKPTNLYHRFSRGLHYPRTVVFDADLKAGKHTLRLRLAPRKGNSSTGAAMRILKFTAN